MHILSIIATIGGGVAAGGGFNLNPISPVADVGIWAALLAGVLSFTSPCVLPLIPAYLSFISGVSIDQLQSSENRAAVLRKTIYTAFVFVLGFSTVFILLGAGATAVGSLLKQYQEIISKVFSVVILIFALHFLGVYRLKFLAFEKKVHAKVKPLNLLSIYVVGLAFAFGWTPCVGPILGSILGVAAARETISQGIYLLIAYSLGLAIPFMLTAIAMNSLLGVFTWVKRHFRMIEIISGVLLLALAGLMFFGVFDKLSQILV